LFVSHDKIGRLLLYKYLGTVSLDRG